MSEIEGLRISGSPTPEEERIILAALEKMLREEDQARRPSAWRTAGRAFGTRNGILDYRGRMAGHAWTHSSSLPWTGQMYNGRQGRGDAR